VERNRWNNCLENKSGNAIGISSLNLNRQKNRYLAVEKPEKAPITQALQNFVFLKKLWYNFRVIWK